ncbi:MAG: GAF domain-containing protein [Desulfobacteraceae bacterium]|nr:MAG: GAF domain-containing protein [Desulfobacteraceae bacterium]
MGADALLFTHYPLLLILVTKAQDLGRTSKLVFRYFQLVQEGIAVDEQHARTFIRRKEDSLIREKIRKHAILFQVGQIITSEMNLGPLFELIMDQTNQVLGSSRSTVFLYDHNKEELWSLVATGMGRDEIRIPADQGIAGWVFRNSLPVIINNAYEDTRFCSEVDKSSGFQTRNILCVPLFNRRKECIGLLQALNRDSGDFSNDDLDILKAMAQYVSVALENSRLFEEVKEYSQRLRESLLNLETLEKIKSQLTKFVPTSVAKLVEQDPDNLSMQKEPADVTILFIDIQGFSTITQGFDQMVVNDMVECHFSKYLECVRRHGGEVNEVAGDGLMVIFKEKEGIHAKEAVLAAMEIIKENEWLNQTYSYPWGRVDLHLGINSGQAWVGSTKMKSLAGERWTYTASGVVTVVAARIGAESEQTRLYIGPGTYSRVQDDFECEPLGERRLKNVKDPISLFWVKGSKRLEQKYEGDCSPY